jgi:hypothetical protein
MNRNSMNSKDSIRKTETGQWAIETHRVFTNQRLVRQGGAAYTDSESTTRYFSTRKQALAFAEKCIENGWSASFLRSGLVLSIDLTIAGGAS